jgi:hypothetical protein
MFDWAEQRNEHQAFLYNTNFDNRQYIKDRDLHFWSGCMGLIIAEYIPSLSPPRPGYLAYCLWHFKDLNKVLRWSLQKLYNYNCMLLDIIYKLNINKFTKSKTIYFLKCCRGERETWVGYTHFRFTRTRTRFKYPTDPHWWVIRVYWVLYTKYI